MKIKTVEFVKGATRARDYLQDLPSIAVFGRSNVGKSSFLNFLCGRKKLARTGKTPGRTREINFFRVNESFYLVDLPGYGYVQSGKKQAKELLKRIEEYLKKSRNVAGLVYLLDIRRSHSASDREALKLVTTFRHPLCLVATKADKLSKRDGVNALRDLSELYQLPEAPIAVSSTKGWGRELVWVHLDFLLSATLSKKDEKRKEENIVID